MRRAVQHFIDIFIGCRFYISRKVKLKADPGPRQVINVTFSIQ